MSTGIEKLGFSSYVEASTVAASALKIRANEPRYNLYSISNILTLAKCLFYLLSAVMWPYIPLFLAVLVALLSNSTFFYPSCILFASYLIYHLFSWKVSSVTGLSSRQEHGSTLAAGLHYTPNSADLIHSSKALSNSAKAAKGCLANGLGATPWTLSGDSRTLIPFLVHHPPTVQYTRRWIRVPLDDNNNPSKIDEFEAVALDWLPPCDFDTSSSFETEADIKAIFMLAGLTGGSQEGYVKDLVLHAQAQSMHSFVMVGRGLQDTHVASNVIFHGARTSDAVACAKALRDFLGSKATLVIAGVSMGGIIATNALVKTNLGKLVDGVVNISGCFQVGKTTPFEHSRRCWQPLLAFGLKGAFVASTEQYWAIAKQKLGEKAAAIVDSLEDVYDFDSVVVTKVHGYASVEDYYDAMSATPAALEAYALRQGFAERNERPSFPVPLLVVHAIDDPIIHVDTVPSDPADKSRPLLWDNHIVLLTETGGHIGWPMGWLPWRHGFMFSNTLVTDFVLAVHQRKVRQTIRT